MLFGFLFWQLQKLKTTNFHESENESAPIPKSSRIVAHGIQSAFLAYLVANFFSFDVFSTFLIFFLMIGYSLYLISQLNQKLTSPKSVPRTGFEKLKRKKGVILFLGFLLLIWFIWNFNVKPFQINTKINVAKFLAKENQYQKAISTIEDAFWY